MNHSTCNEPASRSITVFFPCHNEQDNLRHLYESATEVLVKMGADYEIILVNDGSTDQTRQIADAIAAADRRVRVIHHAKNMGYGSALQSGFKAASKHFVFFTDGDRQFSLDELPPLLPHMDKYDIVSCYRLNRQESFIRRCNAWCWTRLMCCLFDLKLKDINCAFKLYKQCVFAGMELRSTGALVNTEILTRARRRGFSITQTGVHHYPRTNGRQTGSNPFVILRAFVELLKYYSDIKNDVGR